MFSHSSPYKYSPSRPATGPEGEFRLITILPGRTGEKIRCTLQHASITSPPRYEALSYTWGDPKGPLCSVPAEGDPRQHYSIRIGGQRAKVTYNLHWALQEHRHRMSPRVIWIDALCIDQKNDAEKSEQVQLMAKIFSQASKVLVWLGEHDRYVDMAFDTVEQFCWVVKVRVWQYCSEKLHRPLSEITENMVASMIKFEKFYPPQLQKSPFTGFRDIGNLLRALSTILVDFSTTIDLVRMASEIFGKDSLPAYMLSDPSKLSKYLDWHERHKALDEVFVNRNYWSRLWIVQELISATEVLVLCSGRQMDGTMVHCFSLALNMRDPDSGGSLLLQNCDYDAAMKLEYSLSLLAILKERRGKHHKLYESMADFCNMSCSEPQDHIYALLSISLPIGITLDYNKSVVEVYTEATRSIIAQEQNLNILCDKQNSTLSEGSRLQSHMVHGLPSWVPNYASQQVKWSLISHSHPFGEQAYRGVGR